MLQVERQIQILKLIREKGFITNKVLHDLFKVTPITIRRDIKMLEAQNLIRKVHGGALDISKPIMSSELLYNTKSNLNNAEKQAIATEAVENIENGEVIILDTGTTTFEIAVKIKNKKFNNLTILTNDIKISNELCSVDNIKVFVLGGELRQYLYSLSGTFTINFLKDLKADKLFLASDAACQENGITLTNIDDVPVKQEMIKSSKYVILVADSSKFDKEAFCKICDWEKINLVITDNKIPEGYLELFKDKNIRFKICNPIS